MVGHHEGALQKAKDGMRDRASSTTPNPAARRTGSHGAGGGVGSSTVTLTIPSFVQDKKKLTMVAGGLAAVVLVLGILVAMKKPASPPLDTATAATPTDAKPTTVASAPPPAVTPAEAGAQTKAPEKADAKPAEPKLEPVKPADPKLDSKVLVPPPTAAQVPPPATTTAASPADTKKAADAVKAEGAKALDAAKSGNPSSPGSPMVADSSKAGSIPATVFLNVAPWGEVFVNGKSQGVSPPRKFLKLDPGKYRIEIKNTTFPVHVENVDLKTRDEVTLRHRFQ